MKIPVIILFIGFMFIRLVSVAQGDHNAMRLLEMEQYNKAKAAFILSLKTSNNTENWFYLGKIYAMQQKADSARYCFSRISETDPKSILLLVGQAINDNLAGNNSQAMQTLDKAQKSAISSREVSTLVEIAEVRTMAGDTLKWPLTLSLASEIDKKNTRPYTVAGNLYTYLADRYNDPQYNGLASGRYQQTLYYQPDNAEALNKLAVFNMKIRNYTDAEQMLSKVLAKDSSYIPALKNLGELYYTLAKFQSASEVYGRYIKLAEYTDKDMLRYITILYFSKEYSKALGYINQMLLKDPNNPVMLRLKGYVSYELNQNSDGLAALKKFFAVRSVVDTNKVISTDYEYYGKLLSKNGNDSLAIFNLVKASEMDTTKTGLLEDIAKIYEKQKKYGEAVRYYNRLIVAKNNDVAPVIHFSMGKDLLLLADAALGTADSLKRPGYLVQADSAFSKVIVSTPNSYLGYQWRARSLAALDPETTQGLAKADYEKALSILELKMDKQKYANDLIEVYRYLGYYYYLKFDEIKKSGDAATVEKAKSDSMGNWQKVLELDPENDVAKQAISALSGKK